MSVEKVICVSIRVMLGPQVLSPTDVIVLSLGCMSQLRAKEKPEKMCFNPGESTSWHPQLFMPVA